MEKLGDEAKRYVGQLSLLEAAGAAEAGSRARGDVESDEAVTDGARTTNGPDAFERRVLFLRLPATEYEAVADAAAALGVYKQDLMAAVIRRHVDPSTPEGLAAVRACMR